MIESQLVSKSLFLFVRFPNVELPFWFGFRIVLVALCLIDDDENILRSLILVEIEVFKRL